MKEQKIHITKQNDTDHRSFEKTKCTVQQANSANKTPTLVGFLLLASYHVETGNGHLRRFYDCEAWRLRDRLRLRHAVRILICMSAPQKTPASTYHVDELCPLSICELTSTPECSLSNAFLLSSQCYGQNNTKASSA